MLVHERMSSPVITAPPDMPIMEALDLLRREKIRRVPVIRSGELLGIVTDKDLLNASPSQATSLSVWEMNYLLSKVPVSEVMTTEVLTVHEDTPLEEAARIMIDNKVGGLPVLRNGHVVGIITETTLFKIFLEALGARERGVRVTALLTERPGRLSRLVQAIGAGGGHIISIVTFAAPSVSNIQVTCKISGLEVDQVRELLAPVIEELEDIRVC